MKMLIGSTFFTGKKTVRPSKSLSVSPQRKYDFYFARLPRANLYMFVIKLIMVNYYDLRAEYVLAN